MTTPTTHRKNIGWGIPPGIKPQPNDIARWDELVHQQTAPVVEEEEESPMPHVVPQENRKFFLWSLIAFCIFFYLYHGEPFSN